MTCIVIIDRDALPIIPDGLITSLDHRALAVCSGADAMLMREPDSFPGLAKVKVPA